MGTAMVIMVNLVAFCPSHWGMGPMAWDPWDDLDQGRFSVELRPWLSGSACFVASNTQKTKIIEVRNHGITLLIG